MKKNNLSALLLASSILLSNSLFAENIYKWTDDKGTTHYSAKKPSNQDAETITTKNKKKTTNKIPFSKESAAVTNNSESPVPEKKPAETEAVVAVKKEIQPVKQEIKKDKATCERAKKSEITLRSTPLVKQGGKILTIEEKNQQLANVKEIIKIHT